MDQQLLLWDGFCGAGGAGMGYKRAGFRVVGCDITRQPRYAGDEFYQDDALSALDMLLSGQAWNGYSLADFAVLHASPVCKGYTVLNGRGKERHPKLIPDVRRRFLASGKPWVIENVTGAHAALPGALMLCGSMFGLRVRRHRLFESSELLFAPGQCQHTTPPIGVYGHSIWDYGQEGTRRSDGRRRPDSVDVQIGHEAMGIDWMSKEELAQAIPPAYTEFLGRQLLEIVLRQEVA